MKKFGKSNIEMLEIKDDFFRENDSLLEKQLENGRLYSKQKIRVNCKNCNHILGESFDFIKQKIPYLICSNCTHLNGRYHDSTDFARSLYSDEKGKEYAKNYVSIDLESYIKRSFTIYLPKVEFLLNSLNEQKFDIKNIEFCDFGCGSGYFLYSLKNYNVGSICGLEVSEEQKDLGNKFLGKEMITTFDISNSLEVIKNLKSNVISLIGVLEHLENPRDILLQIKNNPNIKYLYISVPTFSFSTFLESFSQDVFSRQLSNGHTHLYTEDSIKYFVSEYKFEILSEWWFGTDILDLYRHFIVTFEELGYSEALVGNFKTSFKPLIDNLQLEIDRQKKSDEVHLLLKV